MFSTLFPPSLQKKVVLFLLRRAMGQFLDRELDAENLDVQLGKGQVVLRGLGLNLQAINNLLEQSRAPVILCMGQIEEILVTVPWNNLWSGRCSLQIKGLKVDCKINEEFRAFPESASQILSSSVHFAGDFLRNQPIETGIAESFPFMSEENDGVKTIANLMERIISSAMVSVDDVTLRILIDGENDFDRSSVNVIVEHADVQDFSLLDEARTENKVEQDGPGIFRKRLSISGLQVGVSVLSRDMVTSATLSESSDAPSSVSGLSRTLVSFATTPISAAICFSEVVESKPLYMTATESLLEDPFSASSRGWQRPRLEVNVTCPPALCIISKEDLAILNNLVNKLQSLQGDEARSDDTSDNDSEGRRPSSSAYDDSFMQESQQQSKSKGTRLTLLLEKLSVFLLSEDSGGTILPRSALEAILRNELESEGKPSLSLPLGCNIHHFRIDLSEAKVRLSLIDEEVAADLKFSRLQALLSDHSAIMAPDRHYNPVLILSESPLKENALDRDVSSVDFEDILYGNFIEREARSEHTLFFNNCNGGLSANMNIDLKSFFVFGELTRLEAASALLSKIASGFRSRKEPQQAAPRKTSLAVTFKTECIHLLVLPLGASIWSRDSSTSLLVDLIRLRGSVDHSSDVAVVSDLLEQPKHHSLTLGFDNLRVSICKPRRRFGLISKSFMSIANDSHIDGFNDWNFRLSSLVPDSSREKTASPSPYDDHPVDDESAGYGFQSWYDIGGATSRQSRKSADSSAESISPNTQLLEVNLPSVSLSLSKGDLDDLLLFANGLTAWNARDRSMIQTSEVSNEQNGMIAVKLHLALGKIVIQSATPLSYSYGAELRDLSVMFYPSESGKRSSVTFSIFSDPANDFVKETNVVVALNDLIVNIARDPRIAEDMSTFFKMPSEMIYVDDIERITKLNVSLDGCQLMYKTSNNYFIGFLSIEKLKAIVDLQPGSAPVIVKVFMQKGYIQLSDLRFTPKASAQPILGTEILTAAQIANIEQLDVSVQIGAGGFVEASNPKAARSNRINMDALGDIFDDTRESLPSSPIRASPGTAWDDTLDSDDCILIGAELTSQKYERFLPGDVIFAYDPIDSFHISNDHFCLVKEPEAKEVPEREKPLFHFSTQNFDIVWKLFDGFDWDQMGVSTDHMPETVPPRSHSVDSADIPEIPIGDIDYENISESSLQDDDILSPEESKRDQRKSRASTRHSPLKRSREPAMEFRAFGVTVDVKVFSQSAERAAKTLLLVRDFDIIDNIRTSTWRKFLSHMRPDSDDQPREKKSDMIRFELVKVRPNPSQSPLEETRLKIRLLPLRLHVDQDALTSLIRFFSYTLPSDTEESEPSNPGSADNTFFQLCEIHPISLKIDYKPKQVDYTNLKDGNLIEILNFFHLDGAEMTLRDIRMTGVKGWARMSETLLREWLPHIRNTQVPRVVSGVSGVKAFVNLGVGIANLILIPIEQYRKDGIQKGVKTFVKAATMETLRLGTRLAVGTQVLLEHADEILSDDIRGEGYAGEDESFAISKLSDQPRDIKEGVELGLYSMRKSIGTAARTILAVPMEVYEKTGAQGTAKAVIRAVPVAVLKPMIGATEAVSKTLIGLQNSLDPNKRLQMEDKYKG
ncbi:autophagy- protein 2 [Dinochytrium kinnereticum]|nr:autophagy- protein 2 [Dinochytrium kinnereticum]